MKDYLSSINEEMREYFKILSKDFPEWLNDYIYTKEMQRIGKISLSCGMDYTNVFDIKYFYSNLDHSVGVALIIWNFTHDKKQTLAGLFHDIATPVFKHCIDFLNDDHEKQESTEEETLNIIKNSKEIMSLLKRDNIKLEEVCDYKKYPIADNDSPKLSADRFEYNFSSGLVLYRVWELNDIRECYSNVQVLKNEDGIEELGFLDVNICEKYISIVSKLWPAWICSSDKTAMQFLADIVKEMYLGGYISLDELYIISEEDMVNKILNCSNEYLRESFKKFQNVHEAYESDFEVKDKYCVSINPKKRYVIPLVNNKRITEVSSLSKKEINDFLNFKTKKYTYFNFDFKKIN